MTAEAGAIGLPKPRFTHDAQEPKMTEIRKVHDGGRRVDTRVHKW